ncbi:MAG: Zn-dependent hydrolase, partial [Sphingobacteriales bacterium]
YMAGILRSVRFGASEAHGKANMQCFNFFKQQGAFTRSANGTYLVDFNKLPAAMNALTAMILKMQGDGDRELVLKAAKEQATVSPELQKDLNRLSKKGIPVDIVFDQGVDVLGMK